MPDFNYPMNMATNLNRTTGHYAPDSIGISAIHLAKFSTELSCDLIVIATQQRDQIISTMYISLCSDKKVVVEQSI